MKTITNIKTLLILTLVVLLSSNKNIAQNVGIGAESFTPDPSAVLELKSTNQGLLPPRMTTEQRDLIIEPAEGLMIYNTTTKCIEYFAYDIWQSFNCAVCPTPNPPTVDTHIPGETQIIWNWNSVAGATGYKWHTANNYAAAIDLGNVTTVTQTGLTCNTQYTIYVWAYNICGNSTALILTQTTSACPFSCGNNVTFNYKGSTVTYGTFVRDYGSNGTRCWMDRNLGATQVATSSTDANAYGDLFQWGRNADGHQNRNSATTGTLSNTDQPGHDNFIISPSTPYDWRSSQNANLWQGVSGTNNPCPIGWRTPTREEWQYEYALWPSNQKNSTGAFNSPLKLTLTGSRSHNDGTLLNVGSSGRYWSSSVNGDNSSYLDFFSSNVTYYNTARAIGKSVRCIKD